MRCRDSFLRLHNPSAGLLIGTSRYLGQGVHPQQPVIERQLGNVRNIQRIGESQLSGNLSGWSLDYNVSGRHGQGTVVMRMKTDAYDDWDVPSAELKEDHRKPINLR